MFGSKFDSVTEWISLLWNGKTLLLLTCLFGIYLLLTWPYRWRIELIKKMDDTLKRTGVYIEEIRGKKPVKLLPKRLSVQKEETHYLFEFELIPGLMVKQIAEKKSYFDAAFNADTYIFGTGNKMFIKIDRIKKERLTI